MLMRVACACLEPEGEPPKRSWAATQAVIPIVSLGWSARTTLIGRSESMEQQKVTDGTRLPGVDLGIASLFNTQIAMLHVEQQALWQRYTAMLVTEAILVGSFGWVQAPTASQVYFASGFGWALCMAWLVTTINGYRLCVTRLDVVNHFAWVYLARFGEHVNPIAGGQGRYQRRNGWIVWMALCVIGLFMLAHTFILAHHLYYRFLFVEGPG
jgi:hypothetical protein